jgi:glycosyltransferase involved in cell wall biosynthesis
MLLGAPNTLAEFVTTGPRDATGILLVGNFLSGSRGTMGPSEELALHLRKSHARLLTTSSHVHGIQRATDIFLTLLSSRRSFDMANVEVYSGMAFLVAEMTCGVLRVLRKPFAVTLHGGGLVTFAQKWPTRVARLLKGADIVLTPSAFLQENLKRVRDDIRYLPNGLELSNYPFRHRENTQPRLCWLRAFHSIYNPEMAVEAISLVRTTYPDIQLTMIGRDTGDGSLQRTERLIQENDLQRNICIKGAIPKSAVPSQLQEADIFLNTTRFESFGIAVMEAAALGMPIVTTAVGELPYLWENEKNAMLVHSGDSAAMAMAIRRVLTEEGLAARLSHYGRQKAESFDWEIILPQWKSVFQELRRDQNYL